MLASIISISLLNLFRIRPVGVVSCHRIVACTMELRSCLKSFRDARMDPMYWNDEARTLSMTVMSPIRAYIPT